MQHKGEQLLDRKDQLGLAIFDLGVQLLGHLPELVGLFQPLLLGWPAAGQMQRACSGQFGLRGQTQQEAGQGRQ